MSHAPGIGAGERRATTSELEMRFISWGRECNVYPMICHRPLPTLYAPSRMEPHRKYKCDDEDEDSKQHAVSYAICGAVAVGVPVVAGPGCHGVGVRAE